MNAIQLIKKDHRTVEELFKRYERAKDDNRLKKELVDELVAQLSMHAAIEEELLYPRARQAIPEGEQKVPKNLEEHHVMKLLLDELTGLKAGSKRYDPKVIVLAQTVRHHIEEEESDLLPQLEKALADQDLEDLGDSMAMAKKAAPTRPHPRAPDTPPGVFVAGTMAAVMDRSRDMLKALANPKARRDLRSQVEKAARKVSSQSGRRELRRQATSAARTVSEAGRRQLGAQAAASAKKSQPKKSAKKQPSRSRAPSKSRSKRR